MGAYKFYVYILRWLGINHKGANVNNVKAYYTFMDFNLQVGKLFYTLSILTPHSHLTFKNDIFFLRLHIRIYYTLNYSNVVKIAIIFLHVGNIKDLRTS